MTQDDARHFLDVLDSHAQQRPGQNAVLFLADGREISQQLNYAALRAEAVHLAAYLQSRYPAQARILLMLPTSLEYVTAFLGCLYAKQVAVPLFPLTSRKPRQLSRIAKVITDAEPAAIICEEAIREVLAPLLVAHGVAADIVTTQEMAAAERGGSWQRPDVRGDTLAFLQYTSGSTGAPKGVMVQHRHLLANCYLMRQAYGFTTQDRMVNWLPLYHDMGLIGGLLEPLYCGIACYLMPPQAFVKTPSVWLEALSRYRGTASFAPNFAYGLCNRLVDDALIGQLDLSRWRHAINGAEPIHPGTLREFERRFGPAGFRAEACSPGYGQAEATLCVSASRDNAPPLLVAVDAGALAAGRVRSAAHDAGATTFVACGQPQPEHAVVIVDPVTHRRCAADEIGELWLRGPSNAAGYWRNPEASEATFHTHIAGEDGNYLRSGDLGFLYQGQVVICARLKDLIILNGRNVYPQDVEFAITDAESAIRTGRVAAFAMDNAELGREELVIVAEPQRKYLDPACHPALFARLRKAVWEDLDCALDRIVLIQPGTIPMTTSGKISRQETKRQWLAGGLAVVGTSAVAATAGIDPAPALAELNACLAAGADPQPAYLDYLLGQVRTLIPGIPVGPDDSLVGLGLDSIALLALHGGLQVHLGWQAPVAALFGELSISQLAAELTRDVGRAPRPAPAVWQPQDRTTARQSYAQQRLWFLHQLDPSSAEHNIVINVRLQGPLDRQALARALALVCQRHAILRTGYADSVAGAAQIVRAEPSLKWRYHDLSSLSAAERQAQLDQQLAEERRHAFTLADGQVIRAQLVRTGPDDHELVLCLHHIAFDGRSGEILLDELARGYAAFRQGQTPALAPLSAQYTDFAEWERQRLRPEVLAEGLAFWRRYLEDVPATLALPRRNSASAGAAHHRFNIARSHCATLERLSRTQGQTLFMTLLGCYSLVLHRLSGHPRFLVGTDVAGRLHPQWDQLIGFFINQLPLKCDLADDPSLSEVFARLRRNTQQAYAYQHIPFDRMISDLMSERSHQQAPLFQVKLNYQRDRSQPLKLPALAVGPIQVEQRLAGFDLVLDLVHGAEGLAACLEYSNAVLDTAQAQRLAALWMRLLTEAECLLDQPVSRIQAQLLAWDNALQQEQQQHYATVDRAQLGQVRRRTVIG